MPVRIPIDREQLAEFCRRHHIRKLSVFGSALRDDFGPASDVDVLYEFEDGFVPGWDIQVIEDELSQLLGHKIDLVPEKFLNRWVRDRVLSEAEVQYAR
jgi:predicted nucleotidyltransferase